MYLTKGTMYYSTPPVFTYRLSVENFSIAIYPNYRTLELICLQIVLGLLVLLKVVISRVQRLKC
jgi:hypothetical protein